MRPHTSAPYPCASAIIGTLTTNSAPLTISIVLRPSPSASAPAKSVEIIVPSATAATTNEICCAFNKLPSGSVNVACKYGSAPEIMPTSTPYSSPPNPATSRRKRL
jgi:hypothetical protein